MRIIVRHVKCKNIKKQLTPNKLTHVSIDSILKMMEYNKKNNSDTDNTVESNNISAINTVGILINYVGLIPSSSLPVSSLL